MSQSSFDSPRLASSHALDLRLLCWSWRIEESFCWGWTQVWALYLIWTSLTWKWGTPDLRCWVWSCFFCLMFLRPAMAQEYPKMFKAWSESQQMIVLIYLFTRCFGNCSRRSRSCQAFGFSLSSSIPKELVSSFYLTFCLSWVKTSSSNARCFLIVCWTEIPCLNCQQNLSI